jgi:glycosyltransferase involved in cell wall biosynthesis
MRSNDRPAVSVIVPAYNAASFLSETVQSALAQTFADFEVLISDDGSTDGTFELAQQWSRTDPRVRSITGPNGGTASARNRAMELARGSFFALLDSDDVWFPTFLESQMAVFERHPEVDVVTGNARSLGGPFDGQPLRPAGGDCRPLSLLAMIEDENAVCVMSVFRRTVFDRIGGFDRKVVYSEDYEFWVRAALAGFTFLANPKPLAWYRRRPDGKSADEVALLTGAIAILEEARAKCDELPLERAAMDRQITHYDQRRLLAIAKSHLIRREFAAASAHLDQLSVSKDDLPAKLMAEVGRRVPSVLLWAYRAKAALWSARALHRT